MLLRRASPSSLSCEHRALPAFQTGSKIFARFHTGKIRRLGDCPAAGASLIVHLIVVHHHLRPGGVRRVIELALPHILRAAGPGHHRVTLASGEAAEAGWREALRRSLDPAALEVCVVPAFGYLEEQRRAPDRTRRLLVTAIAGLLAAASADTVVWTHNPGLGRNPLLNTGLVEACTGKGITLVEHHHDWWFDHRWQRWSDFRRAGLGTLARAARAVLPSVANVRHAAINRADAAILARHLPGVSAWVPNLMERPARPGGEPVRRARRWLKAQLGDGAPVWLLPCRLLRRKNVAEAFLLTRWLRPDAWLVTTGGPSSPAEQSYHDRLATTARKEGWRLHLGILSTAPSPGPPVMDLLAASEVTILTSVQEGFGLPFLEAAAAGRPLVARSLPNVVPDLKKLGLQLPQAYQDIRVPLALFDERAERDRQKRLFREWKRALPAACRRWVEAPLFLEDGGRGETVPFSRLTLAAQLEVLALPADDSWEACAPPNPFLEPWRRQASQRRLRASSWNGRVAQRLSGRSYAARFLLLARRRPTVPDPRAGMDAQTAFMRERLSREGQYPLLWSVSA